MESPRLSIVAAARNDNHGGNLMRRMRAFVCGVMAQAERHRVKTELVLVDWNPPSDKPPLADVFSDVPVGEHSELRVINVPTLVHQRFNLASTLPLYQMLAKNVGVRRSRGEYILATNIDIIFSDEIFSWFGSNELQPGHIYRASRYDVDETFPAELSFDLQLQFCKQNIVRINHHRGSVNTVTGGYNSVLPNKINLLPYLLEVEPLFTNACGDFQMMHRSNWETLRGYPEWDMFSFHLDSVFELQAHFGGAKEVVLGEPFRIYHIEHSSGWTPEADKDGRFKDQMERMKLRRLSDEELKDVTQRIMANNGPSIFNDGDWGLAGDMLTERSNAQ